MFIYKIHMHGRFKDMVVMAERTDRSLEVARSHLVEKHGKSTALVVIDAAIEAANICKLGVVTADIDHLYPEECVIIG